MRCPNCGNENPDDYTFCDECGARLTPQEAEEESHVTTDADSKSAPMSDMSAAVATSHDGQSAVEQVEMATQGSGVCPNCGAATVPGEAYCNECGAELMVVYDGTDTTEAPAAAPEIQPVALTHEGEAETIAVASPDMSLVPGGEMAEDVPVTEDTMPSDVSAGTAEPEVEMPGVVPINVAEEAVMPAEVQVEPEPVSVAAAPAAPATPAAIAPAPASAIAWANAALAQLEEAQAAMAKGDFISYGQSMNNLKAYLESVAAGTVPADGQVASGEVAEGSAPASRAAQPSADKTGPAARLVVISSGAELSLPQQEEITVGREDPSSGIFPDIDMTPYGGEDAGVSRRHARLLHIGNDYFIEDLQSTNYTKLDGQRLPARVREKLEDGARVDFGRIATIFRRG